MSSSGKRKRSDASPSKLVSATAAAHAVSTWPEILAGIQGQKGEPGAIQALNQLCRILRQQAGSGTSKKSSSEPYFQIWSSFLSYWQEDPALKDIVAVWERGDQAGNNPLTVAALQTYTTLLNIASLPSSGIIALGSPYQSPLAKLINELVKLLHYLHKYFRQSGQNDLATAGLELVGALLKIARFTPARNTTSRKIWQALELEAKDVCRLLGTKRKVPMITKQGRRPDIRHLMLSILLTLMAPSASAAIKTDILGMKGVVICIWKALSEDPREVVESTLECMARVIAQDRLTTDLRCRVAEDSWVEVIKLYERDTPEDDQSHEGDTTVVYSPSLSAHRYLLFVVTALSRIAPDSASGSHHQRRALGALLGHLKLSDSEEQSSVALHVLTCAPEMLPGFWTRFAPSLEPRLSSRWVASVAFATAVVGAPVPRAFLDSISAAKSAPAARKKTQTPNWSLLLDTALMPAALGKVWLSKALQQSQTSPLVSYLACNFLLVGMTKCAKIIDLTVQTAKELEQAGNPAASEAWFASAARLQKDASERIPDLQILVAIVQKSFGQVFSRAGSVASTTGSEGGDAEGDQPDEDNNLIISLAIRTIRLYRKVAPASISSLRFDFGRLLSSSFFSAQSLHPDSSSIASLGQASLLELISTPTDPVTKEGAINWPWSKTSEGRLSPIASIIEIHLSSRGRALKDTAGRAVTNLLGTSLLFEHDPQETTVWLAAIPRTSDHQRLALEFLDVCISRTLQTPFKYVDKLQDIGSDSCTIDGCRRASPLIGAVLEQLQYRFGRVDDASAYAAFVQRLAVGLCGTSSCLCLVKSLATAVTQLASTAEGQSSSQAICRQTERYVRALDGSQSSTADTIESGSAQSSMGDPMSPILNFVEDLPNPQESDFAEVEVALIPAVANVCVHALRSSSNDRLSILKVVGRLLSSPSLKGDSGLRLQERVVGHSNMIRCYRDALSTKSPVVNDIERLVVKAAGKSVEPYVQLLLQDASPKALSHLKVFLPIISSQLLLAVLRSSADMPKPDITLIEDVCTLLASRPALEEETLSFVSSQWEALSRLGNQQVDALLARCAESCLPGQGSELSRSPPPSLSWTVKAARSILQQSSLTWHQSKVVAVAMLRSGEITRTFYERPHSYASVAPSVLATLDIHLARHGKAKAPYSLPRGIKASDIVDGFYETSQPEIRKLSKEIIDKMATTDTPTAVHIVSELTKRLTAATDNSPSLFDATSLDCFETLTKSAASFEAFASLETLVNESMKWLVRRFAEDKENSDQVSEYITRLSVCLSASTGKWLLKSHLVEPVITAGIQNRLQDGTSLRFLSALVAQAKLQSASFTRLLQMLLSDSRFRSGLLPASKVRENVVQLVEALHRQQPSLLNDLGGMHVLLAAYQGTLSPSDQALQRIFRLAELRGATSFRSLVSRWVPYELRGSCSTLLQVLASTNPDKLYNACRYVVQSGSTVDYDSAQVFDPVFVVPLLSIILDDEGLTRQSWITLAESNALGVAICTLGSSNRQYQAAGDRILAKARNGLQSAEFRERDEILYILDTARNVIEPDASSTSVLSPLIALFLAKAMQNVGTPEAFEYPLIWKYLLSKPVMDLKDLPLFYNLFYSASDDSTRDRRWLFTLLLDGVHTIADWQILKRRQVVDLLISYLNGGLASDESDMRLSVLKLFARLASIPAAAQDLVAKEGFFTSLSLISTQSSAEKEQLVLIVDGLVSCVRPSKLRRSREGIWIVDVLKALDAHWPDEPSAEITGTLCHTVRRLVLHAAGLDALRARLCQTLGKLLDRLREVETSVVAVQNLYDAVVRLDCDCLRAATDLAIRYSLPGVREELIKAWQEA